MRNTSKEKQEHSRITTLVALLHKVDAIASYCDFGRQIQAYMKLILHALKLVRQGEINKKEFRYFVDYGNHKIRAPGDKLQCQPPMPV